MNRLKIIFMLLCVIGCKESPYQERHKPADAPTAARTYNFKGIVELGTPVTGASVSALKFSELKRGEKLGEALSDNNGNFDLKIESDYDGPLLLVAKGGVYKDIATGETTSIKSEQELVSALTQIKIPEKTNINAWTTLAIARIMTNNGFWDKGVSDLKDEDRINVEFSQLSYFLSGNSNNVINIRRQDFFEVNKDVFKLNDPRVMLHLTHGGLSQLTKTYTEKLANEGDVITVVDLVAALSNDLSDRVFDGKNTHGEVVFVGSSRRKNLTSYTLRKDLSEAIYHYANKLYADRKITSDDILELKSPGKLIDSIAKDTRPELFSDTEAPLPIDIDIPEVDIRFAGKHKNERAFAMLDGDVFFKVSAKDNTGISRISLLAPKFEKIDEEGSFGPISVEHQQNSMEIAIICDKRGEFQSELTMRRLKREDVFCACFEATDDAGNKKRELSCFQRERPRVSILSPQNNATLTRADLQQGIKLEAVVESGIAMTECFWSIYGQQSEVPKLKGEGKILGTKCVIGEQISKDQLRNGDYSLAIQATDIGDRAPNSGYLVDFHVRHDMVGKLPGRIMRPKEQL